MEERPAWDRVGAGSSPAALIGFGLMVAEAEVAEAPDCESGLNGFESRPSPFYSS